MKKPAAKSLGCTCRRCVSACRCKPGWFLPGEAEKAAALLDMTLPEFFRKHLMVDWWERWRGVHGKEDSRDVFVLSPALVGEAPGTEAPGNPRGQCVFLKNNRCSIHAAKPYECRMYVHDDADKQVSDRKEHIVAAWADKGPQIVALLGREPVAEEWSFLDALLGR